MSSSSERIWRKQSLAAELVFGFPHAVKVPVVKADDETNHASNAPVIASLYACAPTVVLHQTCRLFCGLPRLDHNFDIYMHQVEQDAGLSAEDLWTVPKGFKQLSAVRFVRVYLSRYSAGVGSLRVLAKACSSAAPLILATGYDCLRHSTYACCYYWS